MNNSHTVLAQQERFDCDECQELHDEYHAVDPKQPKLSRARQAALDRLEDHWRWQHRPM
jgi:hypothetical protein